MEHTTEHTDLGKDVLQVPNIKNFTIQNMYQHMYCTITFLPLNRSNNTAQRLALLLHAQMDMNFGSYTS
jgi:hypothetical protein